MKIVIETKEDKAVILTAMDCVARHMGYQGLPIQNAINSVCTGLDCSPEPATGKGKPETKKHTEQKDKDAS